MKKTLIVLYKIGFWFYFFMNTGVISEISESTNNTRQPYDAFIPDQNRSKECPRIRIQKVSMYYDQLVREAQAKVAHGEIFSPYDYFEDLAKMNRFRESHGIQERPFGGYPEIMSLMDKSLRDGKCTYDDIDKARAKAFPREAEAERIARNTPIDWKSFGHSCWIVYLKMLPAALILFLLWLYEENNLVSLRLRNPFQFVVLTLLHPLVLFITCGLCWLEIFRVAIAEGEIRRTKKKLFSLLTKDELILMARFKEGLISKTELQALLKTEGRIYHHSLIVAICMSIVLRCIPVLALSDVYVYQTTDTYTTTVQCDHHERCCHDLCKRVGRAELIQSEAVVDDYAEVVWHYVTVSLHRFKEYSLSLHRGFPRLTDPIPLRATTFLPKKNSK